MAVEKRVNLAAMRNSDDSIPVVLFSSCSRSSRAVERVDEPSS
jgi:hypothetical protein